MKTTRFPRLRSLFSWTFRAAHRDASRPALQRRLRTAERLEDRALLSGTSPYPDMVPTVGAYDENVVQPNTVDVTAAGSSMTAAELTDRVATAWQTNSGGVIDGSALVPVYGFGQDLNKFLHMQPYNPLGGPQESITVGTPASPLPISGSEAFATSDLMYSQAMVLIGVESGEPSEQIVEFGLTVLGVNDADYGTVHVLAHAYGGNDIHLTHQVGGPGSEDVFFGFEAAPGDSFGAFTIAYQTEDGTADKPLWFDDVAFITGDPLAGVNSPPVANDDAYVLDEDTTLSISAPGVLANDSDPDGDPLTATLLSGPAHGMLVLEPDGSFTYTPDANYYGTDSFSYVASDGEAGSNAATVTLDIAPVNEAPAAASDAYTVAEDTQLVIPFEVTAKLTMVSQSGDYIGQGETYDLDETTGTFTVTRNFDNGVRLRYDSHTDSGDYWSLEFAAPGEAELTAGVYTGATRFPFQEPDEPGLSVSGQGRGCNTLTGEFTVHEVVYGPSGDVVVFNASFEQHCEGFDPALFGSIQYTSSSLAGVLANDTDAEGDPLVAVLVSGPSHGTLDLNGDGSFTYTPHADYAGSDSFTYVASDGMLDSNVTTVTLDIVDVQETPVASDDVWSLDEDTALTVTAPGVIANDSDADGDPLTATLVSGPSHGTIAFELDGSFSYTPDADYSGEDSFSYVANDGTADSNVATVTLDVAAIHDAPLAAADVYTVVEDTTLVAPFEVTAQLTMVSQPGDFVGQGETYDLDETTGTFAVDRNFGNGVSIWYSSFTDPGGFWRLDFAAPGEAELTAGVYTGATRYPFQAAQDPGLAVSGEGRGCNTLTGEFTVHEVVYGPAGDVLAFDASFEQHCEGATPALFGNIQFTSPALASVLANDSDADRDSLTPVLVNGPSHGTLTLHDDGRFDYTPAPDFHGTDSFTYQADDGTALSEEATVTITVTPVNDPPVASPQALTTDEDAPLAAGLSASDVDGDPLTFAIDQGPSSGTLDLNADGTFTYTPSANFYGTDSFSFTASDGSETSAPTTVSITVNPVNDAPVAAEQSVTTDEDTPLAGTVLASDVDGDSLSFVLVQGPSNGTISLGADGTFTYTPAEDFHGTDSFSFAASDRTSSSNVAVVAIDVTPVNDAPQMAGAAFSIPENSPAGTAVGGVTAGDVDGDSLTYSIIAGNAAGAFEIDPATGLVTVADSTPLDYETTPQFVLTVEATDPGGLAATAAVTISLTDVVEILPIEIDIRPGDATNTISKKGNGRTDVAILSTASFDALDVDMETLRFGRTGTEDSVSRTGQGSIRYYVSDVDGDGRLDLVVQFERDLMGFHAGDTQGILTGETLEGDLFAGQDAVTLTGSGWPA